MTEDYYPNVLKGRYELREKLGEGGMGAVFRCHDTFTQIDYAVKFLTVDHVLTSSGVQRFVHEARLLSHLQHPNIVLIHDYGVEEGIPYLIMELCLNEDGSPFTLKELQELSPDRQLSADHLLKLLPQMLAGVSVVHGNGLIHRDLKPENFLLKADADGYLVPKLSDFGLVAITGDEDLQRHYELSISLSLQDSAAQDRAWVGTYAFMSPEQKRGEQLDARSDVYSLGLIIYRLATGYERVNPELPSEVNPELPEWIDFLVERALAESPKDRWLTAGKMVDVLPPNLRGATGNPIRSRWQPTRNLSLYVLLALVLLFGIYSGLKQLIRPLTEQSPLAASERLSAPRLDQPATAADQTPVLVRQLVHHLPETRHQAAQLLTDRGVTALPSLHRALAEGAPALQIRACQVVGRIGHPSSVSSLVALFDDPDNQVRRAAAEALGLIGQPAVPALGDCLVSDEPHVRAYAVFALSQVGRVGWPAWITGLSSSDSAIRRQAIDFLRQAGAEPAPGLIHALGAPPPARQHAHNILIAIGQPIVGDLIAALSHDDPDVRQGAALALAELRPHEAALSLTELLQDSDADVRRAAHQALVAIGEPAALPLVRLFREADPVVCERAKVALADIGTPALPALMQALHGGNNAVRYHVSETLIQLGNAATVQLTEALHGGDSDVRREVALTLASIPSAAALRSLLIAAQEHDAAVRDPARRALATLGPQAAPHLVDLLDEQDPRLQRHAQALLVQIGDSAIQPLHQALDSDSMKTRIMAAEIMVYLRAESAYSIILTALANPRISNDAIPPVISSRIHELVLRQVRILETTHTASSRAAAEARLVRMGSQAIPVLIEILENPQDKQAATAARLLGSMGHESALPVLVRTLMMDAQGDHELPIATAEALGNLGNLAAIPALVNAVRWKNWELRRAVVHALGELGHEAALPALTIALQDERSQVRKAAAAAMARIGSAEALPALRRASQDSNYDTRNTAIQAIRTIRKNTNR